MYNRNIEEVSGIASEGFWMNRQPPSTLSGAHCRGSWEATPSAECLLLLLKHAERMPAILGLWWHYVTEALHLSNVCTNPMHISVYVQFIGSLHINITSTYMDTYKPTYGLYVRTPTCARANTTPHISWHHVFWQCLQYSIQDTLHVVALHWLAHICTVFSCMAFQCIYAQTCTHCVGCGERERER